MEERKAALIATKNHLIHQLNRFDNVLSKEEIEVNIVCERYESVKKKFSGSSCKSHMNFTQRNQVKIRLDWKLLKTNFTEQWQKLNKLFKKTS